MAFPNKVPYGESISVGVTASEPLICHVEEGVVLLLLDDIADLLPLGFGGINARRVVGACMEQDNTAFGRRFEICYHTIEVQANGVFIVVSILFHLQSGVLENSIMVCPAGRGNENLLVSWKVACEKLAPYP